MTENMYLKIIKEKGERKIEKVIQQEGVKLVVELRCYFGGIQPGGERK